MKNIDRLRFIPIREYAESRIKEVYGEWYFDAKQFAYSCEVEKFVGDFGEVLVCKGLPKAFRKAKDEAIKLEIEWLNSEETTPLKPI